MANPFSMIECAVWVRLNPLKASIPLAIGGIMALLTVIAGVSLAQYAAPVLPDLSAVLLKPDGHSGTWVRLRYRAVLSDNCIARGIHTMSLTPDARAAPLTMTGATEEENEEMEYHPLSAALRGARLQGTVPRFRLALWLPPGMTPGTWRLFNRLDFECPPLRLAAYSFTSPVPVLLSIAADGTVSLPPGQWFTKPRPEVVAEPSPMARLRAWFKHLTSDGNG